MRSLLLLGYPLLAAVFAWCVWCALSPPRLPPGNGYVRWMFSFVVDELPVAFVVVLSVATASVAAAYALATPAGRLGLVISGIDVAGLSVLVWRQMSARGAIDEALRIGLGSDWRARIGVDGAWALRRSRRPRLTALMPARVRRRTVERIADVAYGVAGVANTLDIYRLRSAPVGCPVLIHLHGGALRRGRKNRQGLPLIYGLASRGWLCISANYRLQPQVSFPEHLIDVKKVIAWVRAEGAAYGADPAIVVAGGSSGAQLAALAALTANVAAYQPGFESVDTAVTAAVALYGYYGPVSAARRLRHSTFLPVSRVHADAPPFFVAHGDLDTLTSVVEARHFADSLRRASAHPVVYAELPGAQHGFDTFRSVRSDAVVSAVGAFLAWVLATSSKCDETPTDKGLFGAADEGQAAQDRE